MPVPQARTSPLPELDSAETLNKPGMTEHAMGLYDKIIHYNATIGIMGMGYVGIPLAHTFLKAGYSVIGFDVLESRVNALNNGDTSIIASLGTKIRELHESINNGRFQATYDVSALANADVICICVPTPVDEHSVPNLSYVSDSAMSISTVLRPGQLVVLESTTYPGTTKDILGKALRNNLNNYTVGKDYFLAYSPERENPGGSFDTAVIPKIVGGIDPVSTDLAVNIYKRAFDSIHPVTSCEIGEAAKLLENIYRAVNIALVNELKMIFHKMDIDIWEVIDAAATKPFGFHRFNPGPGWGGHCIPVDPYYLSYKAKEVGAESIFIQHAGLINDKMPSFVLNCTGDALNDRKKSLNGSNILILGVAYKPNVDDCRESPAFPLIKLLLQKGCDVQYCDPHVLKLPQTRLYTELGLGGSVSLTQETISTFDAIIVHTNHALFNLQEVVAWKKTECVIVDTTGNLKGADVFRA